MPEGARPGLALSDHLDLTRAETPAGKLRPAAGPGRIGPYGVRGKLGEGGMGAVYLAEQLSPVRRTVALKVMRFGLAAPEQLLARFELERQVLALMQHPGIAQLYDAGMTAEGEPYFAMEHVDGEPITDYCDRHRLGIAARLRLFLAVCAAVQHAHQKGIIHRDLKPANLLVTERDGQPVPKVIDFGIARAIGGELAGEAMLTCLDQAPGTLAFMSPEQLALPRPLTEESDAAPVAAVDTRSDVYALGVVLYGLLAGISPFAGQHPTQLVDAILRQDPPPLDQRVSALGAALVAVADGRATPPAALVRQLAGDLTWIVGKALEKRPEDRYAAVSELAADLERHLADLPVLAAPPRLGHRLRKLVRRNRLAVTAAALVVASVLGGLAATGAALVRSRRAEARATREAQKAQAANDFLRGMLSSASLAEEGRQVKVAEVLDRAAESLGDRLAGEPEVQASLRSTLGRTYESLGLWTEAERELGRAIDLYRATVGELAPATLEARTVHGIVLDSLGRTAEAEAELAETIRQSSEHLGAEDPQTLAARVALAGVWESQSRLVEAEAAYRDVLARREARYGADSPETFEAAAGLQLVLSESGKEAAAEALGRDLLAQMRRQLGATHPDTLITANNLANVLANAGKGAEAEALLRELVREQEAVRGGEHPETLTSRHNLAIALVRLGREAEAEDLEREVLAARRRVLGATHPHTLISLRTLGVILSRRGRFAAAEPLLVEGYRRSRDELGPAHAATGRARTSLRNLYEKWGRPLPAALAAELARDEAG